jgi:hypothetical protein
MTASSTEQSLPNAEVVHRAFRGSSESAKLKRSLALIFEVTAVVTSGLLLFDYFKNSGQSALLLLTFAAVPVVLRLWADHDAGLARPWRREALSAYINGRDLGPAERVRVLRRVPWLSSWLAARLPAQSLDEYYAATRQPGPQRNHEAYACSALYTAQLQKILFVSGVICLISVLIAVFVAMVLLFDSPPAAAVRDRLTQALCSIVCAVVVLRLFEFTAKSFFAWRSAENTVSTLIESNHVTNEEVCRASLEYDFELVGSPTIPTWLYKLNRNRIEKVWKESLAALEAKWTTSTFESLDGGK